MEKYAAGRIAKEELLNPRTHQSSSSRVHDDVILLDRRTANLRECVLFLVHEGDSACLEFCGSHMLFLLPPQ